MRTTFDEFTFHAMDAMADDWESLDQIAPHIERFVGSADRSRVAHLLVELVAEGLVREMQRQPDQRLTADMILQTPMEFWFAMTPAGRALWDSEAHKYEDDTVA
jgi:hypothetical protein